MAAEAASRQGKFVLVIGPSGVGKSVILQHLREQHPQLRFPRSATTRPRRDGEGDDLYRFVSDAEFDDLLKRDKLLEWAVVHGGARYGTLLDEILPHIERGEIVVREVDAQGFDSIRAHPLFAGPNPPYRLQSIFILPESKQQLIDRITKRAPIADDELKRRIASMEKELTAAEHCDFTIKNPDGQLERTVAAIEEWLLAS